MACGLQESGLAKICHGLDMEQNCTNAFDLNFPGAITYNMSVDDFIKRYIWVSKNTSEKFSVVKLKINI